MKRIIGLFIGIILLAAFTMKKNTTKKIIGKTKDQKVLIVYLTRTKNTKAIAELIQSYMGGRLVELELVTPYPEDYKTMVDEVVKENEKEFFPALKTKIDSIEKYDIVFIGAPTWDMKLPPPMKSFLSLYDLAGKTVIPFNTHAGYGVGSCFTTIKKMAPKSTVLEGLSIEGGIEKEGVYFVMKGEKRVEADSAVKKWLEKIKVLK
jgi:flavodoxin